MCHGAPLLCVCPPFPSPPFQEVVQLPLVAPLPLVLQRASFYLVDMCQTSGSLLAPYWVKTSRKDINYLFSSSSEIVFFSGIDRF